MGRKKGVIFSYILLLVEMFSSLLFTPILIRTLGQAEFGLYMLVASITAYLMLLDLGVGNAIVRYMSKYRVIGDHKQQQSFLGIATVFYFFVALLVIIIGLIFQNMIPTFFKNSLNLQELSKVKMLFLITMFNAAITLALSPFDKTIIAFERFVFSKMMTIIRTILRIFISVIALVTGGDAVEIVTINLVLTIIFSLVSVLFVLFNLQVKPMFKDTNFGFIKEVFGYSFFIFLQMVATQINSMVDQVLLGAMSSSVIVGIYAVGAQISQYFQSIAGSINGLLMPGVVKLVECNATPERLLNEMIRVGRIIFMLLGLIWSTFLIFGHSFIKLWVGQENTPAYWVALIIIFPMVISLSQVVGSQILWAKAKIKIQAYLKISIAFLNIGLTIFLIKWDPLIGASIGTAISLIIGDVLVMGIVYAREIKISMKQYYIQLFKGILPCLLFAILVGFVIENADFKGWVGFLTSCLLMFFSYFITMWLYGMNEYEKGIAKSILFKIYPKITRTF